jgi:hypothetical protein
MTEAVDQGANGEDDISRNRSGFPFVLHDSKPIVFREYPPRSVFNELPERREIAVGAMRGMTIIAIEDVLKDASSREFDRTKASVTTKIKFVTVGFLEFILAMMGDVGAERFGGASIGEFDRGLRCLYPNG